jgi:hypothetical protein
LLCRSRLRSGQPYGNSAGRSAAQEFHLFRLKQEAQAKRDAIARAEAAEKRVAELEQQLAESDKSVFGRWFKTA